MQETPLCLLDEPTSHQDVAQQAMVSSLLSGLAAEGRAVVAAMHDINLAAHHATHALLLDGAGGVAAGPVAEVMTVEHLAAVYLHPMHRVADGGAAWFFPAS